MSEQFSWCEDHGSMEADRSLSKCNVSADRQRRHGVLVVTLVLLILQLLCAQGVDSAGAQSTDLQAFEFVSERRALYDGRAGFQVSRAQKQLRGNTAVHTNFQETGLVVGTSY